MDERTTGRDGLDLSGALDQAWIQYRANFWKVIPFGILAVLPPLGFLHSIPLGLALLFAFEGMFLMMLADTIRLADREEQPDIVKRNFGRIWHNLKNGAIIMLFVLPLLIIGFAALILPSVLFFSLFTFAFGHAAFRDKFGIDACMESYRSGAGSRLPLFLTAFSLYLVIALFFIVAYQFVDGAGWLAAFPAAFCVPYYFMVIEELYEQLEQK